MTPLSIFLIVVILLALILVKSSLVIIPQSETKIIERLGKYYATLKPGINLIIPVLRSSILPLCWKSLVVLGQKKNARKNLPPVRSVWKAILLLRKSVEVYASCSVDKTQTCKYCITCWRMMSAEGCLPLASLYCQRTFYASGKVSVKKGGHLSCFPARDL